VNSFKSIDDDGIAKHKFQVRKRWRSFVSGAQWMRRIVRVSAPITHLEMGLIFLEESTSPMGA
jgi:hypothetical protein